MRLFNTDFDQEKSIRATRSQANAGQRIDAERKARYKELRHTYRKLTKKEIAAQYPVERVETLLKAAAINVQARRADAQLGPGWTDREA